MRTFGDTTRALDFASFSSAYEHLWDIYNTDLLPYNWQVKMSPAQRTRSAESARAWLRLYRSRLEKLKTSASAGRTKALRRRRPRGSMTRRMSAGTDGRP